MTNRMDVLLRTWRTQNLRRLVVTSAVASAACAFYYWNLHRSRQRGDSTHLISRSHLGDQSGSRTQDFEYLAMRVRETSCGKVHLVDTQERGRCLVAAQVFQTGARIRDVEVVAHGSHQAKHLKAAMSPASEPDSISSLDLVTAVDFMASLVMALSRDLADQVGTCRATNDASGARVVGDVRALWALHTFPGRPKANAFIRSWHKRWRKDLAVPVEVVERAWFRVQPNWRSLRTTVSGSFVLEDGVAKPTMGYGTVCGLWLMMALCEHACKPNCALYHDGRHLWFIALREIAVGEALTTSYLSLQELMQPVESRRRMLNSWAFHCVCERCCAESWAPSECVPQSLPDESELARASFCRSLLDSCSGMERFLDCTMHPALLELLFLAALFEVEGESTRSSCDMASICGVLHGESSEVTHRIRKFVHDPAAYLSDILSEATVAMQAAGFDGVTVVDSDTRRALRTLYRRHKRSLTWAHCRARSGFVAAH